MQARFRFVRLVAVLNSRLCLSLSTDGRPSTCLCIFYNGLVVLKNRVENQGAQVDVQLKRRADLIPNLIETTKGYANYEKGTLTAVTELRNKMVNASNMGEAYQANVELNKELARIMVISENYPELKANSNFVKSVKIEADTFRF